MSETYSGWTNYETWVAQLELVDDLIGDPEDKDGLCADAYDLGKYIEHTIKEYVLEGLAEGTTVTRWAEIALNRVNWLEIAESLIEDFPNLIEGGDDDEEEDEE